MHWQTLIYCLQYSCINSALFRLGYLLPVAQQPVGRVVPRRTRNLAARMCARTTHVQPFDWRPVA